MYRKVLLLVVSCLWASLYCLLYFSGASVYDGVVFSFIDENSHFDIIWDTLTLTLLEALHVACFADLIWSLW